MRHLKHTYQYTKQWMLKNAFPRIFQKNARLTPTAPERPYRQGQIEKGQIENEK